MQVTAQISDWDQLFNSDIIELDFWTTLWYPQIWCVFHDYLPRLLSALSASSGRSLAASAGVPISQSRMQQQRAETPIKSRVRVGAAQNINQISNLWNDFAHHLTIGKGLECFENSATSASWRVVKSTLPSFHGRWSWNSQYCNAKKRTSMIDK